MSGTLDDLEWIVNTYSVEFSWFCTQNQSNYRLQTRFLFIKIHSICFELVFTPSIKKIQYRTNKHTTAPLIFQIFSIYSTVSITRKFLDFKNQTKKICINFHCSSIVLWKASINFNANFFEVKLWIWVSSRGNDSIAWVRNFCDMQGVMWMPFGYS